MPMKRWFFWYIIPSGASSWIVKKAEFLTDYEAFNLEFRTKAQNLGASMYRLVWDGRVWVFDTRNDRQLLAGEAPPRGYA
jgi:hypothetical protein